MKTIVASLFSLLFLVFSCEKKANELEKLQEEVIGVHDEVMPKMGELRKTMKLLEAKADSMAEDSVKEAIYRDLASNIKVANESMMQWMRNFDPTLIQNEVNEAKVKEYLLDQKDKIEKVKYDMLESLSEGNKGLE